MSCLLPAVGSRVQIKGGHPWKGRTGVVVEHGEFPISRTPAAIVRIDASDAADGHRCYINALQWKPAKGGE